jgi:imidazolonepropionase-like amidohydrolase
MRSLRPRRRRSAAPIVLSLTVVWASVVVTPPAAAQRGGRPRQEVTALTHATLFDGTGSAPQAGRTILVQGKRILSVFADGTTPLPEGAKVEDLSGKWVIPGIIDAHVHLTGGPADADAYVKLFRWVVEHGVVAVRDMAGDDRVLAFLSRETMLDEIAGPDIRYVAFMAGPTFFAEDPRVPGASEGVMLGSAPWMRAVDGTSDIHTVVAEAKGTGAAALKLYANMPASVVTALTAEAHRQGMMAWAHATIFPAKPSEEVAAGVDVLSHTPYLVWEAAPRVPQDYTVRAMGDFEHIRPDDPKILAVLDSMKAKGEILDATLHVFQEEAERTPDRVGKGIVAWEGAVTRIAHERGVLVDAGTDGMGTPGDTVPNIYREMSSLVSLAGFTPLEAIGAATRVAAMALGISATHGTITPGKMADLVVLSADPAKDIANTRAIAEVWKHGKKYVAGRE